MPISTASRPAAFTLSNISSNDKLANNGVKTPNFIFYFLPIFSSGW
ncbi:hypothetical protein NT04LM_3206 [Listeria monocytogenes FSL F2-208]|nr:hypothetical protein NT04LM_3206 [Listeria monocytogenes FSL F2-208]